MQGHRMPSQIANAVIYNNSSDDSRNCDRQINQIFLEAAG
jgi:hypothetical protein